MGFLKHTCFSFSGSLSSGLRYFSIISYQNLTSLLGRCFFGPSLRCGSLIQSGFLSSSTRLRPSGSVNLMVGTLLISWTLLSFSSSSSFLLLSSSSTRLASLGMS